MTLNELYEYLNHNRFSHFQVEYSVGNPEEEIMGWLRIQASFNDVIDCGKTHILVIEGDRRKGDNIFLTGLGYWIENALITRKEDLETLTECWDKFEEICKKIKKELEEKQRNDFTRICE